jgi:2-polyprenyl-3-methyl-5-hydroxy-6-metoxy-1,4-benzoquinol methylase
MQAKEHWESVYTAKRPEEVSWYCPHLETSLSLIERVAHSQSAIIDIGAGVSTLAGDLVRRGFSNITVLDVSENALSTARQRLGTNSAEIQWLIADVCETQLPQRHYDVWHDRAVFHFLIQPDRRASYVAQASNSLKTGGYVVIGTFGPEGPTRCSGLQTARYDANALEQEFGDQFRLVETLADSHTTPTGAQQQFTYCILEKV